MEEFRVLREHIGDKPYAKGDVRRARRADVQHLIAAGVLQEQRTADPEPVKSKAAKTK